MTGCRGSSLWWPGNEQPRPPSGSSVRYDGCRHRRHQIYGTAKRADKTLICHRQPCLLRKKDMPVWRMSGIHPFLHSADRHIIHSSNRAPIIRPLFPPEQQCPLPFRPFHPGLPSGVGLDLGIVRVAPYGPVLRLLFHPAAEPQALSSLPGAASRAFPCSYVLTHAA